MSYLITEIKTKFHVILIAAFILFYFFLIAAFKTEESKRT